MNKTRTGRFPRHSAHRSSYQIFVFPSFIHDSTTLFIHRWGITETTPSRCSVFPKRFQTLYKL
jgi:hypothetical protein